MNKIICSISLIMCVFLVGLPMRVFAQQTSTKLFDANSTFGTGPHRPPAEGIPFASTSLILNFEAGDTAVVSSTPDGTGPIVIDNFMTINGVNICVGVEGQQSPESCFGKLIQPDEPTGVPIQTVLTPIPPIDVTTIIPGGTTNVVFQLQDFGRIAGNTNLFLVTTASVVQAFNRRALPSFLKDPKEGFTVTLENATQNTPIHLMESAPYYDAAGNRCPAPVPVSQRQGCVATYVCERFSSGQCVAGGWGPDESGLPDVWHDAPAATDPRTAGARLPN